MLMYQSIPGESDINAGRYVQGRLQGNALASQYFAKECLRGCFNMANAKNLDLSALGERFTGVEANAGPIVGRISLRKYALKW